jgi:site-specific DNA-cytosine methylase
MKNAGIDVVAFSENNTNCIQTHEKNFENCKLISTTIDGKQKTDITLIPDEVFEEYKN